MLPYFGAAGAHVLPAAGSLMCCILYALQDPCFLSLEAPITRVCGLDTPFPLAHEKFYVSQPRALLAGFRRDVQPTRRLRRA